MENAKLVLETIVNSLIKQHDQLSVVQSKDEMGVLLTVKVAKEDMGRIIGKEGNTAKSIRSIIRAIGMAENARISVKIDEPEA